MSYAIVGKIRSGKDTVGEYIEDCGYIQMAFGDSIGGIIEEFFPEALENGKPRRHYQHIGQEFRKLNPYVWINAINRKIQAHKKYGWDKFVITDVRQLNEIEYLQSMNFKIIKVVSTEENRFKRMRENGDKFTLSDLNHETEKYIYSLPYDYLIENNGTLEELFQKVQEITGLERGVK